MGAVLVDRANHALDHNPPGGQSHLSVHGSDWLWAVTAVFILAFLFFYALSFIARGGERIFHYIFTITLLVGIVVYFAEASDLGWSVVNQINNPNRGQTRQVFFAKYIYWVVSFPAMILSLGLLSGISWATIAYQIFLSWVWIISYLVGAYTYSNYKWGFFAFGTLAYIILALSVFLDATTHARRLGYVGRDHGMLAGWLNLLWLMYPIAWGLSDGGNRIGITPMFVFFGVLDVLMVPLLSFAFLVLSRSWDYHALGLEYTQYGRVGAGKRGAASGGVAA